MAIHSETSCGTIVAAAIARSERSVQWVSDKSGIPRTTLKRKITGGSDFTLAELLTIAEVLGIHPTSLLPAEFQKAVA